MTTIQHVADSHIHFWNPNLLRYEWLDDEPTLNRRYEPDQVPLTSDRWSVDSLVFIEAGCLPAQAVAEAAYIYSLGHPRVHAIVAYAPLETGGSAVLTLELLKEIDLVRGVRRMLQFTPPGFMLEDDFITGVRLLAHYDYTCDLCIKDYQLPEAIQLVRNCPDVRFVLDHVGSPDIASHLTSHLASASTSGSFDSWRTSITEIAALPNVYCKLSGLVTMADREHRTIADLRPYFDHALNAFTPDRLMFGSDSPIVELAAPYETWLDIALDLCADLTSDERRMIFHDTAHMIYSIFGLS